MIRAVFSVVFAVVLFCSVSWGADSMNTAPEGYTLLFNGTDFSNWRIPEGDNGHWRIVDGVIDYDAQSEAPDDKCLWTEKEYGDFEIQMDWRIKETPFRNPRVPVVKPNGDHKKDEKGREIIMTIPDSDSGIYVRGTSKAQINIWCWPVGSGEVYGYRMDKDMPPEVRAGVTPKVMADNDIGEWNTFIITVKGNRLTVVLNGITVIENAELPELPERGPIALQHHGSMKNGKWQGPPSLVQFRNIYIKEL